MPAGDGQSVASDQDAQPASKGSETTYVRAIVGQ